VSAVANRRLGGRLDAEGQLTGETCGAKEASRVILERVRSARTQRPVGHVAKTMEGVQDIIGYSGGEASVL
jgi:hypothetical protein